MRHSSPLYVCLKTPLVQKTCEPQQSLPPFLKEASCDSTIMSLTDDCIQEMRCPVISGCNSAVGQNEMKPSAATGMGEAGSRSPFRCAGSPSSPQCGFPHCPPLLTSWPQATKSSLQLLDTIRRLVTPCVCVCVCVLSHV